MRDRAIIIFSAGIKQDKSGEWYSTDLLESENFKGAPGGKIRILATKYLYDKDPQIIITTAGQGHDENIKNINHPNISNVVKQELIGLGIPGKNIIEENKGNTTYGILVKLIAIIKKLGLKEIKVVSSKYNMSRIKAMIENIESLNEFYKNIKIKFISAEDLLIKINPDKWEKIITEVYNSKILKALIKSERKGIEQIKNNTYNFRI